MRLSKPCWSPWIAEGFEYRDTGIAEATSGLADVSVVRRTETDSQPPPQMDDVQLCFTFLLKGEARLHLEANEPTNLSAGDSWVVPPGHAYQLESSSRDFEFLRVTVT